MIIYNYLKLSILIKLARHSDYFKKQAIEQLKKSKTFCILPWIHTHFSPTGKASLCCISASHDIGDVQFEKFEDLWNNKRYRHIRKMMLLGRKPYACEACHKNEKVRDASFRKEINQKFAHQVERVIETNPVTGFTPVKPWAYMDIRFSNKCNFKCRTCDPIHSHLWFADMPAGFGSGKPTVIQLSDKKYYPAEQIEASLNAVEEIYFAGGEPLILDEHYQILSKIVAQ
jgi:hypothetical protein